MSKNASIGSYFAYCERVDNLPAKSKVSLDEPKTLSAKELAKVVALTAVFVGVAIVSIAFEVPFFVYAIIIFAAALLIPWFGNFVLEKEETDYVYYCFGLFSLVLYFGAQHISPEQTYYDKTILEQSNSQQWIGVSGDADTFYRSNLVNFAEQIELLRIDLIDEFSRVYDRDCTMGKATPRCRFARVMIIAEISQNGWGLS